MSGCLRLCRVATAALRHTSCSLSVCASGQHLLGTICDKDNSPSTSRPTAGHFGPFATSALVGNQLLSGGSRHISFWGRDGGSPAHTPASAVPIDINGENEQPPAEVAENSGPAEFFPLSEGSLEALSAIQSACDAVEKASIAAAKADAWFAASWFISALQTAHETLGTPWWLSIALFNVSLRIAAFPLMIVAQKASAKMVSFNHKLIRAKRLQEASMKAKTPEEQSRLFRAFQDEYQSQVSQHGNPLRTALLLPGVMITNGLVFLSIFSGVNKLMAAKVPSLTTGGTFTFTDLTVPDPWFVLPVTCTVVTLLMVQYGMALTNETGMPVDRAALSMRMKWVFRFFALMFIPAGAYLPAGVGTLWVSNTLFGVVQGVVMRSEGFRRMVGLPTLEEMKRMNEEVTAANVNDPSAPPPPKLADPEPVITPLYSHKIRT